MKDEGRFPGRKRWYRARVGSGVTPWVMVAETDAQAQGGDWVIDGKAGRPR